MNLKTHTAYPEIQIDRETFDWQMTMYCGSGKGKILDTVKGKSKSYEASRAAAIKAKTKATDAYLIPEAAGEVETITAGDVGTLDIGA